MALPVRLTAALFAALGEPPQPADTAWADVPVRVDACVDALGIDRAQLGYLVGNELEGVARDDAARMRDEGATIVVACEADEVLVRVEAAAPRSTRVRTTELDRAVATRTLALAIVELVAEAPEPKPSPQPEPPQPKPPVSTPPPRVPAPVVRTRWIGSLGFDAIGFPLTPLGVYGGAVALRHRPAKHFGWMVALAAGGGFARDPLGRVQAIAASAFAGAVVHGDRTRIDPWGAVGVRGGWATLAGRTDDPNVRTGRVHGAWLGPALRGGLDGVVGDRLVLGAHLELGWAAIATRAEIDGRAGPGLARLWIGGGVSIGLRWPPRSFPGGG